MADDLHEWTRSTLGHGETMCRHCGITNREAAVLGQTNGPCPNKKPAADDLKAPTAEEMERAREWAAEYEEAWRDSGGLHSMIKIARCFLALHARVADHNAALDAALETLNLALSARSAQEARATTAEATLARYREALEEAQQYLLVLWGSGSHQGVDHRALRLLCERIRAALLPSPAAETEESRGHS